MFAKVLLTMSMFISSSYITCADQTSDYEYGKKKKTKAEKKKERNEQVKQHQKEYRDKRKKALVDLKAMVQILTTDKEKQAQEIETLKQKQRSTDLENKHLQQQVTFLTQQRDLVTSQYFTFWEKCKAIEFANNVFDSNNSSGVSYQEMGTAQAGDSLVSYQVQGMITSI